MAIVVTATELGSAIEAARKANGLSQAELARRAGTTQSKVSHIENGKDTTHVGIVLRLIAALGLVVAIRAPGDAATAQPAAAKRSTPRPGNVVFDEPLPDDSIDIDAIATGKPAKSQR